ncbi:Acetyltransferase (GNAT) domain protein [uncultured archaeon]|nr:Acetyltransferase (GNAT) domain protein [uncultured archaeon]
MEEKIPQDNLKVEKLSEKHKNILETFKTENVELKKFLVEDALRNQELVISNTYLWFYKPNNELVAYITILTDAIGIHGTGLGEYFQDKGILYKTLPALKIGRICVGTEYLDRGIGTYMIKFAMIKLLIIEHEAGCRFIFADVKREAVHFYKKLDFVILKLREKGTIPMYLDMIKQIETQRDEIRNQA